MKQTSNIPDEIRQRILARDGFRCVRCSGASYLHVHHRIPVHAGGLNEDHNLVTLCQKCHAIYHPNQQISLSRRFIEWWALKLARWLDSRKQLPPQHVDLGHLLRRFGVDRFRPGQLSVILAALRGESFLYVSPTGSGKSLCFQLPAITKPSLCIVFAPLKTLMMDQVTKLHSLDLPATFLNSDIWGDEKRLRLKLLQNNSIKFLYCAPERFGSMVNQSELKLLNALKPSLIVLDEAHVLPKWQTTFRPDYGKIQAIRNQLGNPQIIAFTATAGIDLQRRIMAAFGVDDPSVYVRDIDRLNILLLKFKELDSQKRIAMIQNELKKLKPGKALIFVPTVKIGNEVSKACAECGLDVPFYHGKLNQADRDSLFNRFKGSHSPKLDMLICTNAFGMGIDIPNIRLVAHWQHPSSVEDYVQEYGRAGRDNRDSTAILFCRDGDQDSSLYKFMMNLQTANDEVDEVERQADRQFQESNLKAVAGYAKSTNQCLRQMINQYFEKPSSEKVSFSVKILDLVYGSKEKRPTNSRCCSFCMARAKRG